MPNNGSYLYATSPYFSASIMFGGINKCEYKKRAEPDLSRENKKKKEEKKKRDSEPIESDVLGESITAEKS
jgi:hypothetical protein